LLRLAWPIIVSRSTQVVVGLADALMVAHLGEVALASVTTGAMNSFAAFILPMGTVFIVSSFVSQHFGRGDLAGARRYALYGLGIAAFTQVLSLAMLPALSALLGLVDLAPEVRAGVQGYLTVRLLAGGLVVGLEALAGYYGGQGNTRLPMVANLVAMVLNIAGNWLLIDGNLGFPALGVRGAAWASVVSTGVAFTGLLAFFLYEGRLRRVPRPRLAWKELGHMLRIGLPAGFNWFFEFFAFIFFVNVVVAGLGTRALAALMAVMQLNSVSFMPAFAVASAGAIIAGQSIGAGAKDEVPHTMKLTFMVSAAWQLTVGLVYLLLPELAFSPFARGEDPEGLIAVGAHMLRLSAAWLLFDSAATTLAEVLRAAGDTTFTLWARVALAWLVFVPGSYASVHWLGGGPTMAMLWLMLYLGGLAAMLWLRFRNGAWRRLELVQSAHQPQGGNV
ncbi:MAG TPA: MATE family efflux transporter, partial [Myxococcaceae bacterium]|nr:MATE family efflux transporter [Myxococcaceae bacterium]